VGSAEGYVGGTRARWLRRQASPKTEGAVLQRYLAGELSAPLALMHLVIAAPEPGDCSPALNSPFATATIIVARLRAHLTHMKAR
jgi:hypothetical protein